MSARHDTIIRDILRRYPAGQHFNELLQNADDAGAKEVLPLFFEHQNTSINK